MDKEQPEIPFTLTEAEGTFIVDCLNAVALNGQQSMARIGIITKLNAQFTEYKRKNEGGESN